jgi:hypothetical protein
MIVASPCAVCWPPGRLQSAIAWDKVGHQRLPLGVAGREGSTILVPRNACDGSAEWKQAATEERE